MIVAVVPLSVVFGMKRFLRLSIFEFLIATCVLSVFLALNTLEREFEASGAVSFCVQKGFPEPYFYLPGGRAGGYEPSINYGAVLANVVWAIVASVSFVGAMRWIRSLRSNRD